MEYKEHLAELLQQILEKQPEAIINKDLARICRELDSFIQKIKDCLLKNTDLPKDDEDRIIELTKEYNENIEKYKKLKGI